MSVTASMVKELRERTGAGMMECKKALVEANGDIDAAIENMRKSGQAKADKKAGRVAAEGLIAIELSDDATSAAMVEVNCETDFVTKEGEFQSFVSAVVKRALEEQPKDAEALGAMAVEKAGGASIDERRRELVARIGENISLRRVIALNTSGNRLGAYVHGGRIGVLLDMKGGDETVARDIAMHVAASRPLALSDAGISPEHLEKEREILKAQVADSGKPPEIQEKMIAGRLSKYLKEVTLLGQPFVKDPDISVEKYLKSAGAEVLAFTRFEVGEGIEKKSGNFADEVMAQVRGS
ncbi:MAG: translation elongation factor Ts [Gammaproteobacteria bacterium]|nr:translation elongation factor Ts [Gammaproteobacteria bacterium]MDH3412632.1 translation elongation factor Ts [Gammaproteobacteria bacterium]